MPDLLARARQDRTAVASFTCYTLETAVGVLDSARDADRGVCLLLSDASFRARGGRLLAAALVAACAAADAPAFVQLDHCTDISRIRAALDLGVGAVMADGSRLPYEENVAFTGAAVQLASGYGAAVEAELGHIEGNEDRDEEAEATGYTDPGQAAAFVAATGVDCLAVAIGNIHGTYRRPPRLDWRLLRRVAGEVDVPLSLHGTSGLPAEDVRRALVTGVRKVNVNTELRRRQYDVLAEQVQRTRDGLQMQALVDELARAAYAVAGQTFAMTAPTRPDDAGPAATVVNA